MNILKTLNIFCIAIFLFSCSNDDNTGRQPTLDVLAQLSPSNNERPVSKTPILSWEAYNSDQPITYTLFLGTSETTLTEIGSGTGTEVTLDGTTSLELDTTYYWQIAAFENENKVAESEVQTFTTETIFASLITENAAYGSRKAAGVAVFNDKIWVTGGLDDVDTPLTDIWSSVDGENWVNEGSLPFGGIAAHKLIVFNDKLWIYGGLIPSISGNILSRKIFSSENGVDWVEEMETAPFIQYDSSRFIVLGDKLFRIAGFSGDIDDLSPERYVYSSTDGLNWNLETENHGFETKYSFQVVNFNEKLYGLEPNPDSGIEEIKIRASTDGIDWSDSIIFDTRERGINSIGSTVLGNKIILMTTPENGPNSDSTFYESINGEDWIPATSLPSVSIRAIYFELVNLNGELFAIGGTLRSNFTETNNTVWKLN